MPTLVVQCGDDKDRRWLATKGPGHTNRLTKLVSEAFHFEDETVANLYAKIWTDGETTCRAVELENDKR